jgi:serine protease DegQ
MRAIVFVLGLLVLSAGSYAQVPPGQPPGQAPTPKELPSYSIPFKLTNTQHIMVRAKLNGKGPFNLIVDTGAPALFISTETAKKCGVEIDKRGWANFDSFVLEGGVELPKAKGRVEDLYQLKAMNGMGLPGVELHGVIGYNILAQFRIEYDLTKDRMVWTRLNYTPPPLLLQPGGKGGKDNTLEGLGGMMKMLGGMMGKKANLEARPRGFLGVELADTDRGVVVTNILAQSPADQAGLRKGDRIVSVGGRECATVAEVFKRANRRAEGEELQLQIERDGKEQELAIVLGKGL